MKKYLLYILCLFVGGVHGQVGCLKADILLVADLSGSVQGQEGFIANAYEVFVNRFDLDQDGIRIGAFVFSKEVYLISHLTHYKGELLDAVDTIRNNPLGTTTNLSGVINQCYMEYASSWRDEARKIIILISDGHADNRNRFLDSVAVIKRDLGAEICAVYVHTYDGYQKDMRDISEGYCYVVSNYQELALILERLNICG